MAKQNISYIVDGTGSSIQGAEKILAYQLEKRGEINPFLSLYAKPIQSEAISTGGQKWRFLDILGYEPAEQADLKSTDNTIEFEEGMKTEVTILEVQQPLWAPTKGKVKSFVAQDSEMLDGINFFPLASFKIVNTLMKGEITRSAALFFDKATGDIANSEFRAIDESAKTTSLEQIKAIKEATADYADIEENNSSWTTDGWIYFDGLTGALTKDEIEIHIHPSKIAFLSDINTEAGAGSLPQYTEFTEGTLSRINGVRVVENRWVAKNKVLIVMTANQILAPDPKEQITSVMVSQQINLPEIGVNGFTFFDSTTRANALVTVVSFDSLTP